MAAMFTLNMKDFAKLIARADPYPFYAVLLYTPMNGLDARIHRYVVERWDYLNTLTGPSCLLVALEDPLRRQDIQEFKPEDVYGIARYLGASVDNIPCIIFFTDPQNRNDTLILKLNEFLPDASNLTDEEITDFFRALQSIVDSCSGSDPDSKLACLRKGLRSQWPSDSRFAEIASRLSIAGGWLVSSVVTTSSIVEALSKIVTTISPFLRL
jgi:hypothetical protein